MNSLVSIALTNAASATLLAAVVWAVTRCYRHPALAHLLWAVVLVKLFTPSLIAVPIAWNIDLFANSEEPSFVAAMDHVGERPTVVSNGSLDLPAADSFTPRVVQRPTAISPGQVKEAAKSNDLPGIKKPEFVDAKRPAVSGRPITTFRWRRAATLAIEWLPIIWICGIGICALIYARRAWQFRHCIRQLTRFDPALSRRVEQLGRNTGLSTVPHVVVVPGPISPMLWGIGRHTQLIFPKQLVQQLTPAACDTLLLHELAHYRRGDQWLRLMELAAQVCYWWHPVVWWACHEIEAAEEQCCDAWVVEHQSGARRTYAEALLAAIDFIYDPSPALPPAASGLGEISLLRLRLMQIMQGNLAANLSRRLRLAALVVAAAILPVRPALLGASVPPLRNPRKAIASISPQRDEVPSIATEPSMSPSDETSSLAKPQSDRASATLRSLPVATLPRAAVTATAVSPNGKYRLERRKAAQVSLVNQLTDWRLDMTAHGIRCVAFMPDSQQFVTGHEDGIVRVWDSDTGGLVTSLRGANGSVLSIDVASDASANRRVAAGSKEGSIIVWDLASGDELARMTVSDSSVSCLRWSPQGDRLAIGLGDFSNREQSQLLIWSPMTNEVHEQLPLEKGVAALTWLSNEDRLLLADWNGKARLYQLDFGLLDETVSLGANGKQIAEAAHWSADCSLANTEGTVPRAIQAE
jgi:beta-lactamase regulating signal transducer with metallopeptidase domain